MDDCLIKPTRLATLREQLNRWKTSERAEHRHEVHRRHAIEMRNDRHDELDLSGMAQLWGSKATVKALLDAFVSSFRDDLKALEPLLERGTVEHLREWHHRVVGAASVLQYRPLLEALEAFRRDLPRKSREMRRREGMALIERCTGLLERIEAQGAAIT